MNEFQVVMQHPVVLGALGGFVAAARVDYVAFQAMKDINEARAYSWKTAAFRWFQGALGGAIAAREVAWVAGAV